MKKKLISDDPYHVVWLQQGIKRLRTLKLALEASGMSSSTKTMAVDEGAIDGRESSDIVVVNVKATDKDETDEVTVLRVPPQYYFGHGSTVEMRCRCKGIQLVETEAAVVTQVLTEGARPPPVPQVPPSNYQLFWYGLAEWIEYHPSEGVNTHSYTARDIVDNLGNFYGSFTGDIIHVPASGTQYIGWPSGVVDYNELITLVPPKPPSMVWATFTGFRDVFTGAVTGAWTSLNYETINAQAQVTANRRSAAFITDSTELGSIPLIEIEADVVDNPFFKTENTIIFKTDVFPVAPTLNYWFGGDTTPIFTDVAVNPFDPVSDKVSNFSGSFLSIQAPEDTCSPYVEPSQLRDVFMAIYREDSSATYFGYTRVAFNGSKTYKGYGFSLLDVTVPRAEEIATVQSYIDEFIIPSQNISLSREDNRRKRCSNAQHLLLRDGFLPPEFEYFIKVNAPRSTRLKRKIPMRVLNRTQVLTSDITDAEGGRTRLYTASVTIGYDSVDEDGNTDTEQNTFTGTVERLDTTHRDENETTLSTTTKYTYTNLPMLINGTSGKVYPLPAPLPPLPYTASIRLNTSAAHWHDDRTYPLMVEANGTFNNSAWMEDNTYAAPKYPHNFTTLTPPVEKTTDNLVFTHPQFLLDYFAANPPIETETIDGDKVPVTPSTDWLSSRLTDGDIVSVVPLNFVGGEFGNYGMFPFRLEDDEQKPIIEQLKIYGYAEFQYLEATASFTFVKWVELIEDGKLTVKFDDEVTLDDDDHNPTTITVVSDGESNTYTLAPKSFDYDEAWGNTNCVCTVNKAAWTDLKASYKTQKSKLAAASQDPELIPGLTPAERLYLEVQKAIA
jgi:hypothetical protein